MIACVAVHRRFRLEMHLVGVEGVIFSHFQFDFHRLRDVDEVLLAVVAHQPILLGTEHLVQDRLVVEELFAKLTEVFDVVEAFHAYVVGIDGLHSKLQREGKDAMRNFDKSLLDLSSRHISISIKLIAKSTLG